MIEVVVGVGTVEDAVRDVVDAQVEPGVPAAGPERCTRPLERLVGHLPVDVEPLGLDGHRRHPVLPVAPRDVLWPVGLGGREPEIELAWSVRGLLGARQDRDSLELLLDPRRKRGLGEPVGPRETEAPRTLEQLPTRVAEPVLERRGGEVEVGPVPIAGQPA